VSLRPATEADLDALATLEQDLFGHDAWSRTSVAACATHCAPSTRIFAPKWCASVAISFTGLIVPRLFEM